MSDVRKALEAAVNQASWIAGSDPESFNFRLECRAAVLAFLRAMPESFPATRPEFDSMGERYTHEYDEDWTPTRLAAAIEKETP